MARFARLSDIPTCRYDHDAGLGPREPGIGRLNRVPIIDCGEPLVPLEPVLGKGAAFIKAKLPWARKTVAQMLAEATKLLPKSLTLRISTSFRTVAIQRRGYNRYMRQLAKDHPEWPRAILVRQTNKFFHPPDVKAPPGHCTGGALDIGLARRGNGQLLDHVSTTRELKNSWPTFCPHLTEKARLNRAALYQIMSSVGFSNCYDEWWHWSYGDTGWAERLGKPEAIYGLVTDYPPDLAARLKRSRSPRKRGRKRPMLDRKR
jgi:D-alanyl-D-alanine dipeptidase